MKSKSNYIKNSGNKNKVALVTGGIRRLGRQISYFLAEEGYNLAIIYNSSSKKDIYQSINYLEQNGASFILYKCDITDLKALKKTVDNIGKQFGKIDLLINNAGTIKRIDFEKITPKLYDETMSLNLRSQLFLGQYSLKYLRKSKNPNIINIASLGGMQNWNKYMPYSLSKTGVIKLTYLLAKELAPKIRVNAISPGTIIIEGEEKGTPQKTTIDKIPLKKYGIPEDIIEAIRFILRCEYLTGHVIPVDGGRLINP